MRDYFGIDGTRGWMGVTNNLPAYTDAAMIADGWC